jgi:hypothetical protein
MSGLPPCDYGCIVGNLSHSFLLKNLAAETHLKGKLVDKRLNIIFCFSSIIYYDNLIIRDKKSKYECKNNPLPRWHIALETVPYSTRQNLSVLSV